MNPPPQGLQNEGEFKMENMTRDELKKIQKSMKKPEFMGLLNEYMIEISDPKNRQQYDEYLRQMEREGQLPKSMKLAELNPQFCIRTNIVSQKNKKHNMKFFINYCSTQFLEEPNCQPSLNQQGKSSFGWKVPNSMGKIRYDQDKNGNPCQVADVAFNSKCFQIISAEDNLPFRKNQFKSMLISIGLQCAQKQLGQRKQTLSKDYDILKNLKCKGGKPALLPLRYIKGRAYNKGDGPAQGIVERDTQGRQTKLQKQINQSKQHAQNAKTKEQTKAQEEQMQEQLEDKKVLVQDLQTGIQQPKYSSIYTYPIDYSQFLQDPSYSKASKVPSNFTVEFKLPRVQELEQIGGDSLTVNENRIVLKVGEKYFIDLSFDVFKLKYKLLTDKIKAKFDKKKKVLRVILTIDRSIKYEDQPKKTINSQNTQENNQQQKEAELVEDQVWKNKVLQVSETNVGLKLIEDKQQPAQVQQVKNKLIQQIDEDDYPQQANQKHNKNENQPQNFDEALQHQKNHAFSLRKYFNKTQTKGPQNTEVKEKPNILTYVFQQTGDKVVLVIKMQNYKRQEVKAFFDENISNNFFIEWNQNQPESPVQISKIHILNFKVSQTNVQEIKKVQIVLRVNFLAIFLHKKTVNKFWQKQSIEVVSLESRQSSNDDYEAFKTSRELVQRSNLQRTAFLQKIKEEKEIKQKVSMAQHAKGQNHSEGSRFQQEDSKNTQQAQQSEIGQRKGENQSRNQQLQNIDQRQKQENNSKLNGEYFNFNNLQPQFIHFDCKFIEAMD